ncbi:MAG: hypothetical protein H9W81_05765 [Enterococcus sp.]|nr:hypothetical protein [Enterococcus sp.]
MTNTKQNHENMLSVINSFYEEIAPLRERFYNFITQNPCKDISVVPDHDFLKLTSGEETKEPVLALDEFHLELPALPVWKNPYVVSSAPEPEPRGVFFTAEIELNEDYMEERYFTVPYEYFDGPDAWETDVLARINRKNALAWEVIEAVYPGAPKEIMKNSVIQRLTVDKPQLFINLQWDVVKANGSINPLKTGLLATLGLDLKTGDVYAQRVLHQRAGIDMTRWNIKDF